MNFEETKIRKMLKLYGASDIEIENFINDLKTPENAPSDDFDSDEKEIDDLDFDKD